MAEGWQGWDEYADFYDWENAQTLDRRDVSFWQDIVGRTRGTVLELGCGTGRVTLPVARRGGRSRITLVESVRQDRGRGLTIFDQRYIERRGREKSTRTFSLVFRTITVPQMTRRLERAGFRVSAVLGDYGGKPWDSRADV